MLSEVFECDDVELTLRVAPHRSWSSTYWIWIDFDSISAVWLSQSDGDRPHPVVDPDILDVDSPHERRPIPHEAVALIQHRLRQTALTALPEGKVGLGGCDYTLTARDHQTEVSWSWWSTLPTEWAALAPVIAYLQDPSDENLCLLRQG